MIRNIDIVFRLLALPFHIAVARFWTVLAVIAIGYVAVTWLNVEPVRIVIYGFVALAVVGFAVSAQQWDSGSLAGGIVITALIGVVMMEPVFDRVLPKNPTYEVTTAIPVDFRFRLTGETVMAEAINRSHDWLEHARVACQGYYGNGEPVEQPWMTAVAGFFWLPPGEGTGERRLSLSIRDTYRYDLARTQCQIAEARFRQSPVVVPSFSVEQISGSGLARFHVINDTSTAFTAVRFTCQQGQGVRATFTTSPMLQKSQDYLLKPGGTIDLVSDRMFTKLESCRIYSVDSP
ncbi:hypothetical protein [Aureimonas sp. AU12]|uniref:hypothetical protein n=1 Tax=Aureimonas sp. AU12 TaxID=1638161 RepID=UPI0007058EA8|nr:hypothetical protein [Aureimonas sp. AU12]BAT29756.1 leucyl/phenylalanyl-tRNA--protein transferase [Aureimonas sp. AU12]